MCQSLEKRENNGFVRGIEVDPNDLIKNVSFVVYAYLGGGARQVIVPSDFKDKEQ
jgi:hypothetical protein